MLFANHQIVCASLLAGNLPLLVSAGIKRKTGRFRNGGNGLIGKDGQFDTSGVIAELEAERISIEDDIEREEELLGMMQVLAMSMDLDEFPDSSAPSKSPSAAPTAGPTISVLPSSIPTMKGTGTKSPSFSIRPSFTPSSSVLPSTSPSVVAAAPPVSVRPSSMPTLSSSVLPSTSPSVIAAAPSVSVQPSNMPTVSFLEQGTSPPTTKPSSSVAPSAIPSSVPSPSPSMLPSDNPSLEPTSVPTVSAIPSASPSELPSLSSNPSSKPTLFECRMTPKERSEQILTLLADAVSEDVSVIQDISTPQGLATDWLINADLRVVCPDDDKLVQRWVLAVMYYSTGGENWIQCSADDTTCGSFEPFLQQQRFLSKPNECQWAGISCNADACATEIEFEENDLVGTVPTELGLLNDLAILGMEQGELEGTIPSEIGNLSNLVFLDFDFNFLTGSLPPQIYLLRNLTQLDLNNNELTGTISDDFGKIFENLEFLQLHSNFFEGTINESFGNLSRLTTMTLHENDFTGSIPASVCALRTGLGVLGSLIVDCAPASEGLEPDISCDCCTACRAT